MKKLEGKLLTRVALSVATLGLLRLLFVARDFQLDLGTSALGLMTGMVYGLLALGLVLVYRSSRFINFAHGDIGFIGAVALLSFTDMGWPYWIAFIVAILVAAGVGAATEVIVVRRLSNAPKLMSMVATLLLSRFLLGIGLAMNGKAFSGYLYPQPDGFPAMKIGVLQAKPAHIAMIVLTPVIVAALVLFLRRGRLGLSIAAAAANPDAAAMAGIRPVRTATMTWAIAGGLAGVTAMLWLPTRLLAVDQFGPSLLVRGLAAAVVARMESLPKAFAAGAALGILESVINTNSTGGEVEIWMFGVILIALLAQRRQGSRDDDGGSWTSVMAWPPLPAAVANLRIVKLAPYLAIGGLAGLGLALMPLLNSSAAANLSGSLGFVLVGLSLGLVSGLAGQLSLGQFAIAAAGAVTLVRVTDATGSTPLALLAAAVMGALISVLVGLPALRLRGLLLAVVTLAFALATQSWILTQPWAIGGGYSVPDPSLFGVELSTKLSAYPLAIAVTVVGALLARNIRRSGFGRVLVALRDNEDAARAFTIHATGRKLQAYGTAGAIAGMGGSVYALSAQGLSSGLFPVTASVDVVALTVIGGVSVLAGPLLGTLFLVTLPAFVSFDIAGKALHLFLALVVILLMPNGLAASVRRQREWLVERLSKRAGLAPESDEEVGEARPAAVQLRARELAPRDEATAGQPLLVVDGLRRAYGGVVAVESVSFELHRGETLGLIGPNGAGKTTLFELLSGFTMADQGRVLFKGIDVTRKGPEARANLGMIRSFQEAALFPTMTLLETVKVAHERVMPSKLWRAALGVDRDESKREERARELIALMGLDGFRDKQIAELSTGTRRMGEIACLLALEPELLLLDEPASGVAQKETEQLGALLEGVKRHLDTTLIVIEHDIPLIRDISDRVLAMESGSVLALGTPDDVLDSQAVADAFLGGSIEAINRSGTAADADLAKV